MTSVLRLGVYRERIEKYGGRASVGQLEDLLTVTLERQPGKHLGIRLLRYSANTNLLMRQLWSFYG